DEIFYHPEEVARNPFSLLLIWEGIGSFSGWIGAALGIVLWKRYKTSWDRFLWNLERRRKDTKQKGQKKDQKKAKPEEVVPAFHSRKESLLPYADLICSVLPVSWVFGRLGCAVVHDHKGAAAASPNILTVAFPDGPHYDLGLLEMLYTIVIALVCASLW